MFGSVLAGRRCRSGISAPTDSEPNRQRQNQGPLLIKGTLRAPNLSKIFF
jgi:hypothetical protein